MSFFSCFLKVFICIHCVVFITCIFLEEAWWNPESLDQDSQDYLHLLLGLFDLLVCGASEGSNAVQYRALMNLLLKVIFLHLLLWIISHQLHNCKESRKMENGSGDTAYGMQVLWGGEILSLSWLVNPY